MSIFVCIAIESEGGDDFAFDTFEYFCQIIVSRPESGLSFTDYLSYFFCRGRVGRMKLMLLRLTTSLTSKQVNTLILSYKRVNYLGVNSQCNYRCYSEESA
jgi:hypothetical protein